MAIESSSLIPSNDVVFPTNHYKHVVMEVMYQERYNQDFKGEGHSEQKDKW
jgi:hypothetical protein